jgi:hypothetical protein
LNCSEFPKRTTRLIRALRVGVYCEVAAALRQEQFQKRPVRTDSATL